VRRPYAFIGDFGDENSEVKLTDNLDGKLLRKSKEVYELERGHLLQIKALIKAGFSPIEYIRSTATKVDLKT
jgi:hypothetical protein